MGVVCEAVAVWCFPRSDRKGLSAIKLNVSTHYNAMCSHPGAVTGTSASLLPFLCVCCVGLVTAAMMTSRVASNYSNYSGIFPMLIVRCISTSHLTFRLLTSFLRISAHLVRASTRIVNKGCNTNSGYHDLYWW